ncbi:hypothetical protein K8R14_00445 [bacterium]|nr:hypothetical protein [bacterium]
MSKQTKDKKPEEKQLNLNLKQSPFNIFAKHKERFDLFRARWDTRRYTKSNGVWFTIVLSVSLIATQVVAIQENLQLLPKQIPLYQLYLDNTLRLAPSSYLYLIPFVSCLLFVITLFFSNKYYNKERTLSNLLLLTTFLGTLIMTISLIRLINLY